MIFMAADYGALISGIIVFIVGFVFLIFAFRSLSKKRLIENTPTSKIGGLAMGFAEIFGTVVAEKILKSPLTNKDCVYYKYNIDEYKKQGKSHSWVTIRQGKQISNFYLKDDTGSVLVNPERAKIDVPEDYSVESGMGKDPPTNVLNFLKENNISFEGFFGLNRKMRFIEYYIAPGDKLFILGTAGENPNLAEGTAKKSADDIMIQKSRGLYYISDKTEKDVIKKFKWKIIGWFIAGGIISLLGLFFISAFFGIV